jgi:hypothetical protein
MNDFLTAGFAGSKAVVREQSAIARNLSEFLKWLRLLNSS